MVDPVVAADGHTYEREAILRWWGRRRTSPLTGLRLPSDELLPNYALKSVIQEWREGLHATRLDQLVGRIARCSTPAEAAKAIAELGEEAHDSSMRRVLGRLRGMLRGDPLLWDDGIEAALGEVEARRRRVVEALHVDASVHRAVGRAAQRMERRYRRRADDIKASGVDGLRQRTSLSDAETYTQKFRDLGERRLDKARSLEESLDEEEREEEGLGGGGKRKKAADDGPPSKRARVDWASLYLEGWVAIHSFDVVGGSGLVEAAAEAGLPLAQAHVRRWIGHSAEAAAEAGLPLAQARVGRRIGYSAEAEATFEREAASGGELASIAMCFLGDIHRHRGSEEEALRWYTKAAEAGNGVAMTSLVECACRRRESRSSATLRWLQRAVKAKLCPERAYYPMALFHQHGLGGLVKDPITAAKWYRRAAEAGDIRGDYAMGVCHEAGRGVPKQIAKAMESYQRVLAHGCVNSSQSSPYLGAMAGLARCHWHGGEGVTPNTSKAVEWRKKATDAGLKLSPSWTPLLDKKKNEMGYVQPTLQPHLVPE